MTTFYSGTLQEGIALAVKEAKAVVCFARDDVELSSTWEDSYFADPEITQALHDKAITLRLVSGSQEAGFLTSFCPISNYPTVVVIKNGTLQEFITSEVSKEDFLKRLEAALEGKFAPPAAQQPQAAISSTSNNTTTSPTPPAVAPSTTSTPTQQPAPQRPAEPSRTEARSSVQQASSQSKPLPKKETKVEKPKPKQEKPQPASSVPQKPAKSTPTPKPTKQPKEEPKPQPPVPRGPPTEYRLQVRLFDGSSVRSTFTPTQTIRKEVRAWLDQQMTDDNRPYNLKHILTPLPSRTLSVSEESQTLEELGLGSTANLVMVPVQSFTSAYTTSDSSLPVRGISAVYNMASSVASTATGFVGSFLGYGQTPPPKESEPEQPRSTPAINIRNTRSSGPNIRTLHDRQNDGRDSQLYNGNQLNFEPRKKDEDDR